MTERPRGYALRVDVSAEPERVWRALTEAPHLVRWCSAGAQISARVGGSFRASVDRETEMHAHIDLFESPRRLRLIHLGGSVLPAAEHVLVDDLILEPRGELTVVRNLGSGFPADNRYDAAIRRHQTGWRQSLARLKVYLEKRLDEEKPQ